MEEQKLSSGSQEKHAALLGELAQEFRQFNGLGASFFRAAAARIGMTVTDMQVIDILDSTGPTTAGQLADLTGLTTGAITGMLNRLEEAGLVRRERDPNDGRRVIVRLAPGKDEMHEIGPIFASLGMAWDEMASHYDDEQIAFLLEFLKRSNAMSRKEIVRVREVPEGEGGLFSAPLEDLESGRLSVAISWRIVIQGGASEVTAELGGLDLAGLEVKGGLRMTRLELPEPSGVVPIRISGGASVVTVRRPAGVAARVHLKGWASEFVFDDQTFSGVGNDVRLQSPGFDPTAPCYDIEVSSSASMVTITSG